MRFVFSFATSILFLTSCDDQRVFEKYNDLDGRQWSVHEKPSFEFEISDTTLSYNLYCNVRNSSTFPYSRIFIGSTVADSTGNELRKELLTLNLFDRKTGKPFGSSALGDIFDHRIQILSGYSFKSVGRYNVTFEQFMRQDTLSGVLSIGVRVEKVKPK